MQLDTGGSSATRGNSLLRVQPSGRSRWRHRLRALRWPLLGGLWLLALGLGYVGFRAYWVSRDQTPLPTDLLYLSLQLFILESGSVPGPKSWELEVARLLAPAVAGYTALQALAVLFYEQSQSLRLRLTSRHAVICGLGRKGFLLAQDLLEQGIRVVVIELDEGNDALKPCRERGGLVLVGDATDRGMLRKAGVDRARYLLALCGDDSVNAEIAVRAQELLGEQRTDALACFVHLVDPQLCRLLREREIGTEKIGSFRLEFFDVFDRGVRALLKDFPFFPEGSAAPPMAPHLLVVGAGRLGQSLIVQAARSWWSSFRGAAPPLRITLVDRQAEQRVELLTLQHPLMGKACHLIPEPMDVHSPAFHRGDFLFHPDGHCPVTAAYVCLDGDSIALSTGLVLLQRLRGQRIPIVVRMSHLAGLATLLPSRGDGLEGLHAFGLLDRAYRLETVLGGTHELLARAIHEEYLRDQASQGKTCQTNPSMAPWEELPESLRESNRQAADHIGLKLKAVACALAPLTDWEADRFQFSTAEVELMARLEHERFVRERRTAGWKPGPRDPKRRTTPYLVSWEELPEEMMELDRNQVRALPALLARAGFQVYRKRCHPER